MSESFLLTLRALVRGFTLPLLLLATVAIHLLLPALVRGDGTDTGWREMFVRAVPGAAYAVVVLTAVVCACGLFARERERFRLSLTVVRPVPLFAVACGRWLALLVLSAAALTLSAAITFARLSDAPRCMHHLQPTLPPPVETARVILEDYLRNPDQIEDPRLRAVVTNAPRAAVLRLLVNKEIDRYDIVPAQSEAVWPFEGVPADVAAPLVRVRFATQFDLSSSFAGTFALGALSAVVSNKTQAVLDVPLARGSASASAGRLVFRNTGDKPVMLRPRRDLEVLVPADSFAGNLARATLQMFGATALLAALGLFLSSALSRPVAIFTVLVLMAVVLIAPSVVESFPEELQVAWVDRIGLLLSRAVGVLTSAAGEANPVSDLATDTCVEWRALLRGLLVNVFVLPCGLLALASAVLRRKPLADRA